MCFIDKKMCLYSWKNDCFSHLADSLFCYVLIPKTEIRIFEKCREVTALRRYFESLFESGAMSGNPLKKKEEDESEETFKGKKVRTAYDIQRHKLEKLMKDPSRPVFIPTPRSEKDPNKAPDYVYNVRF